MKNIFIESLAAMTPMERTVASNVAIYGGQTQFIDLNYREVVELAIPLIRSRKHTRSDAVSMCYESLLAQHGAKKWKRVGEVVLLRGDSVARALCFKADE